jgi:hypothetical protein
VGKIDFFHFFTGSAGLALCRVFGFGRDFHSLLGGFFVFSAAALCVVFVKSHKKDPE